MTCGSSCCGPRDIPAHAKPPADDTCFGPNVTELGAQSPNEPAEDGYPDACCDGSDKKASDGTVAGDLCGSGPSDGDCQQDCCGSDTRARDEATVGRRQQGCRSGPKGSHSCGKDKTSICDISEDHDIFGGGGSKAEAQKPCQQSEASCCETKADKGAHCTKPAASTYSRGCCPVSAASKNMGSNSSCCGDKVSPSALVPAEADCNEGCCSERTALEAEDPSNPSCCKDKVSPCCDVSCIDRIALRECDVSSGMSSRSAKWLCG